MDSDSLHKEAAEYLTQLKEDFRKEAFSLNRLKRLGEVLGGRNVEKAVGKHYQKVMDAPYLRALSKSHPMSTVEDYVQTALHKGQKHIPGVWDLPSGKRTKGRKQIIDRLMRGQAAVGAELQAAHGGG